MVSRSSHDLDRSRRKKTSTKTSTKTSSKSLGSAWEYGQPGTINLYGLEYDQPGIILWVWWQSMIDLFLFGGGGPGKRFPSTQGTLRVFRHFFVTHFSLKVLSIFLKLCAFWALSAALFEAFLSCQFLWNRKQTTSNELDLVSRNPSWHPTANHQGPLVDHCDHRRRHFRAANLVVTGGHLWKIFQKF